MSRTISGRHVWAVTQPVRVDVWERPVTAWPSGGTLATGEEFDALDVQHRVDDALALELSMLSIGEVVRLVSVFGGGKTAATLYRSGILPAAPPSQLGTVVGLGEWASSEAQPSIGGDLVRAVFAMDSLGIPIPWRRVRPMAATGGEPGLSIWSRLADRLVHNPLPIALIVDVLRAEVPTLSEELVIRGLEARSHERAARRAGDAPRTGGIEETGDRGRPVGDYLIAVGVVGDLPSLVSAWRSETGQLLGNPNGRAVHALSQKTVSLVTAPEAAKLLPLPVLAPHSTVTVRRFRPRTSAVTRPISPAGGVLVARTDSGADIGFDADTVNRNLLVVGDVGTGKSITTMSILRDLWNDFGVPWLVIDPLKYEYAHLRVAPRPGERVATVPVRHLRLGQVPINPLAIPSGVDSLAFASAMAAAFSTTSALGEAFPLGEQVARAAFNQLYATQRGQNPTFADLEAALMEASHQEGMTGETASNIRTSLLGRLRAITSGVAGDVFAGGPQAGIDWRELSRFPTVFTFPPGIGQQEKAVVYALLVAAHWSWRLANPTQDRHVVVLEEIHQIYGRSNPQAAAVLDSLLSTMRASGQGYLAVTQTPHQLEDQTQRLFQNIVAHRTRHIAGLEMFHSFGASGPELQDLDDGEVVALLRETAGVRGRVPDRSGGAGRVHPITPTNSYLASEFTTPGPTVRGWCSACPSPCRGRSWLNFASAAATAADASLASSGDVHAAAVAAVDAARHAATGSGGETVDNRAGLYCAAARGVTVALGVRGLPDVVTRLASAHVRSLITEPAAR